MEIREWISSHHNDLITITKNITGNHPLSDDLYQEVMLQLLNKSKDLKKIPTEEEMKWYFISVVRLNFYSKTSRFYYKIRKPIEKWSEYKSYHTDKVFGDEYQDKPDMNWVRENIKDLHWYKKTLFEMWLEEGSIRKLSEKTTISKNTCGIQIREIKDILITKWLDEKNKNT